MPRFRKKPVEIEAVQWDVTMDAESAIEAMGCRFAVRADNPDYLLISTLEGTMQASPWDWIIKGVKGEFYPCKPEIFEATYVKIDSKQETCATCEAMTAKAGAPNKCSMCHDEET